MKEIKECLLSQNERNEKIVFRVEIERNDRISIRLQIERNNRAYIQRLLKAISDWLFL